MLAKIKSSQIGMIDGKNIIFSSRSFGRKGKIVEANERHDSSLAPALSAEKFKGMMVTPYAFFRGATICFGRILLVVGRCMRLVPDVFMRLMASWRLFRAGFVMPCSVLISSVRRPFPVNFRLCLICRIRCWMWLSGWVQAPDLLA